MASERMLKIFERDGRNTSSNDPKMLEARVFIGNLPSESVTRQAVENIYKEYGKILGISMHKSYGFVQFDNEDSAKAAVKATHGTMMSGKRLDVNIATERRKEPSAGSKSGRDRERDREMSHRRGGRERDRSRERYRGRGGYRSPSPMSRLHMDYDRMHPWERLSPYSRPPPPPHLRDPYLDPYHDPYYMRLRDDPFDRLPPRDYPPPPRRDPYGPPLRGDPYDHHPRALSPPGPEGGRGRGPPPPPPSSGERRGPIERVGEDGVLDMEIIVVNRPQREYGEMVKSRMEGVGIRVEMATLNPTVSLSDALDSAAQRGLLYCIIITGQHEMHRSVTLTILHGRNPQEHKNMPLDDALGLIDRDFERYCLGVREGRIPPRKPPRDSKASVSTLLSKAASGEELDPSQLQSLINILQEKKQNSSASRPPPALDFNSHQLAKEDIQRQQADLQAKILSLLGSNAVVPSPSSQGSASSLPPKGPPGGLSGMGGGAVGGGGGGPSGYPSSGGVYGSYGPPRGAGGGGGGDREGVATGRGYGGYGGYGY